MLCRLTSFLACQTKLASILPLIILITHTSSFGRGTTLGMQMNSSTMDTPPIEGNFNHEQQFQKNSMTFFSSSSFGKDPSSSKHDLLFFNIKTELINITRKELTVNTTTFPQITNQGIRSVEFNVIKYIFTDHGWRLHAKGGYNTKGYEKNNNIAFALNKGEMAGGIVITKNSKYKDLLAPILTNMFGVTTTGNISIEVNAYSGEKYIAKEILGYTVFPLYNKINFKILGKIKKYTFDTDAPRKFVNEEKIMGGPIFQGTKNHAIELNIYHDFITKELGTSIGYLYHFNHNNTNPASQTLQNLEEKYKKPSEKQPKKSINKNELREMITEILEQKGYE
jgi:hypothetical protein